MKAELPSLAETVSVCEPLGGCTVGFSLPSCGAAAPAGCVGRPRRALPAVLGRDRGLAGPAPLPAGAVIAEGFVYSPDGRRFFCKSAWQCNFGFSASAACRYSCLAER